MTRNATLDKLTTHKRKYVKIYPPKVNAIYMNEIKLLFFVLMALMGSLILLWIFDEPEIIEDKEIEIITTLGIGLLILIVDRKADHRINTVIQEQHELVKAIHNMLQEQNKLTKNIETMLTQK